MIKTRENHFVAQWYQQGFIDTKSNHLCYLNCRKIKLKSDEYKTIYSKKWQTPAQRFYQKDLYSTFFGTEVNDEIERKLFGPIDNNGSKAIRAFLTNDQSQWHYNFHDLFIYLDAQKIRTPKGLDWIKSNYPELSQIQLMTEMQSLRAMHCTLWAEGVRELVSAEDSDVKFIVSDHPVTIYNYACPPDSKLCKYPNDPDITLRGSQTIFPLNKNRCLILTNLEYARDPNITNPLQQRTNATRIRQSMVNTIEFINTRKLTDNEVNKINFVIKSRSKSSVAAGREEWLYPEKYVTCNWDEIRQVLLPPSGEIYRYNGEMFAQFEDGSVHYQDSFGRTTPQHDFLNKSIDEKNIGRNDLCGCGSGQKYKNCCRSIPIYLRTTWSIASIRERNIAFCKCIRNVLGLDSGKTWLEVRRELSDDQISKIYGFYSALWPRETDIYSLLPKSDGKFRGLYSGCLDVRVIFKHALPMASLFDEFLIETPVINPNNVRPEFNPTKSPGKYKYQALKDFLFMLEMEPFIRLGLVNFIPNPSEFDLHLMRAMMDMAESRDHKEKIIVEKDFQLHCELLTEDLLNSISIMPREAKIQILVHELGLTEQLAAETIAEFSRLEDTLPLMMLQKMDTSEGGQLHQIRMGPNYEMALFVAQVTGSVLVTDSGTRWNELLLAQHREQGFSSYPWETALRPLSSIPIDHQFLKTYRKSQHHFAMVRNLMKAVDRMVLQNDRDGEKLTKMASQATALIDQFGKVDEPLATCSLTVICPEGGLYDTNVQRLLAQSSCPKYDHQVRSVYGIGLSD